MTELYFVKGRNGGHVVTREDLVEKTAEVDVMFIEREFDVIIPIDDNPETVRKLFEAVAS